MKKIIVSSLAVSGIVLLSGCQMLGKNSANTTNTPVMPKEDNSMMRKDEAMMEKSGMMEKSDTMMKDDGMMKKTEAGNDTMMKKETPTFTKGSYVTYSAGAADQALASGKKVALFFHASWCPSCQGLHKTLSAETIPSDVVVFKVDYDSSTELKKTYGVTGQHTVVTIDSQKNMIKKERGAQDIADIVALF